jgi:4-hydroxybenzoate polyprenyltransferase
MENIMSTTKYNQLLLLMRPHQYIKNIFIFAPLLFAFNFTPQATNSALIAFVLFSFIASSIYIINDYMDLEEDKKHPTKQFRPLASGKISKQKAMVLFAMLSSFSLLVSYFYNSSLFLVLFLYFILNITYSIKLKHIPIVDIFIISTGFVLRLFAGSVTADIRLSHWIIIMTFLLALFLAIAKRRDDVLLSQAGKETRKNIDGYNLEFVNASMVLMSAVVIVSYILYTVSVTTVANFGTQNLYLTTFFVILGIMRYMQITFVEEKSGSPTKIVLKDRFLQFTILAWISAFIAIVKI